MPDPVRLLFVSHSFPPRGRPLANVGGMQRVATELYAALQTRPGVAVSGMLLRTSWRWTHVRTVPFLVRAFFGIRSLALQKNVDVVLFSSMVAAALAVLLRPILAPRGVRMAAIVHGRDATLPAPFYQRLVPRVFDALDAVLPVSRATGNACLQRGLAPEKLVVVPNGVKVSRFAPLEDKTTMRRELIEVLGDATNPLPGDALLLCSVGRQVERKGFAWFVDEVMPRLPEDVHYWLVGDGPEEANIRVAIERHDLENRVRLLGRVSDDALAKLYRGADLFVMPNRPVRGDMEGFGVVMLEAGLGGLPAIAARLEGILDVITDGVNGHLIETGDAEGFAEAIRRYHNDRKALAEASARAYRHTVETFGWPAVAARYVDVLAGLKETDGTKP